MRYTYYFATYRLLGFQFVTSVHYLLIAFYPVQIGAG